MFSRAALSLPSVKLHGYSALSNFRTMLQTTSHADRFSRRRCTNILPVQQLRASNFMFEFASSVLSSFFFPCRGREGGELDSWEKDLRSQFMENDRMDGTDCMQR